MTTITLELSEENIQRLMEQASCLNVTVQQLTTQVITDFLAQPDERFQRIAKRVIEQNQELYRRLA